MFIERNYIQYERPEKMVFGLKIMINVLNADRMNKNIIVMDCAVLVTHDHAGIDDIVWSYGKP